MIDSVQSAPGLMERSAVFLAAAMMVVVSVYTAVGVDDTSGGDFTLTSPAPTIGSLTLYSDDDNGSSTAVTELTPFDEMTLDIPVTDSNTLGDLETLHVVIFNATATTEGGADTADNHMNFTYTNATDAWTCAGCGSFTWDLDASNSNNPTHDEKNNTTTFNFRLVFTPGKVTDYSSTTTDWDIEAIAVDDTGGQGTATLDVSAAYYVEISAIDSTFSFGTQALNGNNLNLTTPGESLSLTVISNDLYDLSFNGSDWVNGVFSIDLDDGTLNSLRGGADGNIGNAFNIRNSFPGTPHFDGEVGSSETGTAYSIWLWLNTPASAQDGQYTMTLYARAIQNT